MNREVEKSWRVFNVDLHGEQSVKIASNAAFALLVVTVLMFTVIAVTYKPPDPWLQSSRPFANILIKPENDTFVPDDSVIITAEDTPLQSANGLPPAVSEHVVAEEIELHPSNSSGCEGNDNINCSAPAVLFSIQKYNLNVFPLLDFYSYRTPVRGSSPQECDVAWKCRSSKDGSPRLFRDYRRYSLSLKQDCDFHVDKVGDWHSGINARPLLLNSSLLPGASAPASSSDLVVEIGVDTIDDGVVNISESSFQQGRYLHYQRGGDYCKSMNQYMWSLLCALGEAKYLDRTFVMDLELCLPSSSNPGHDDEPGKDFRFYYDFEHLRESLPIIDQNQFLRDWDAWDSTHQNQKIVAREVHPNVTSKELRMDTSTVLRRVFSDPEPKNYWFRVCEGETEREFQRPWDAVWKSRRINDIVLAICGRMGWDYDAVHVVRGEKANNKERWPNLDSDTSPDALIQKLDKMLGEGRNVYIATNEQYDHYFDKLRGKWKIFQLDDFSDLWGNSSEWYKKTMELNGGKPVEFDGYMKVEVDSEILYKSRNRVETFNDLTEDCKGGIGACS